jgi:hypothetical protein
MKNAYRNFDKLLTIAKMGFLISLWATMMPPGVIGLPIKEKNEKPQYFF